MQISLVNFDTNLILELKKGEHEAFEELSY